MFIHTKLFYRNLSAGTYDSSTAATACAVVTAQVPIASSSASGLSGTLRGNGGNNGAPNTFTAARELGVSSSSNLNK